MNSQAIHFLCGLAGVLAGACVADAADPDVTNQQVTIANWSIQTAFGDGGTAAYNGQTGHALVTYAPMSFQGLLFRFPEVPNESFPSTAMAPALWTQPALNQLTMQWTADNTTRQQLRSDWTSHYTFGIDEVEVLTTVTNPSPSGWSAPIRMLNDVLMSDRHDTLSSGRFIDTAGLRTYIYRDHFQSLNELGLTNLTDGDPNNDYFFGSLDMAADLTAPAVNEITDRVMAKIDSQGQWLVGIASDTADTVIANTLPNTSNIHQDVRLQLAPGASHTMRSHVYVLHASPGETAQDLLDAFWLRYQEDFGDTALHDANHNLVPEPAAGAVLSGCIWFAAMRRPVRGHRAAK